MAQHHARVKRAVRDDMEPPFKDRGCFPAGLAAGESDLSDAWGLLWLGLC